MIETTQAKQVEFEKNSTELIKNLKIISKEREEKEAEAKEISNTLEQVKS